MQRSNFTRYASLPGRFLVGFGFIEHGFAKLSRGPDAFAGILQQLGVPLPHLAAWLTIGTEILRGLTMLLGVLVFWASIPMAVVLLVAMISVHLPYGFSSEASRYFRVWRQVRTCWLRNRSSLPRRAFDARG